MNCMLSDNGGNCGFENGSPNALPEINSSMPEFNAVSWLIEFVDADKSRMYVVTWGSGKLGKVSSPIIEFKLLEIELQPLISNAEIR